MPADAAGCPWDFGEASADKDNTSLACLAFSVSPGSRILYAREICLMSVRWTHSNARAKEKHRAVALVEIDFREMAPHCVGCGDENFNLMSFPFFVSLLKTIVL